MSHHTRPIPSSKPAVPCRAWALADGSLVALDELAPDRATIGQLPGALGAELLDLVESLPTRGHDDTADRLARLLRAATRALGRAREHFGPKLVAAAMHGFVMDFCVDLPRRTTEPRYRFVRLHCGPDDRGDLALTLGLPTEL